MTLLSLAAAFVLGVLVALQVDIPTPVVLVWLGASALAGAAAAGLRRRPSLALLPLVLVLGMVRVELFESDPDSALASYHGRPGLQVEGTIAGDTGAAGPATRFRMDVDRVSVGQDMEAVSGAVQVTAFETSDLVRRREPPYYRYGDRLRLTGTLEPPPDLEDFDFPAYLASQGIHTVAPFPEVSLIDEDRGSSFYRWLYVTRGRLERSIDSVVPEPQASLGKALLLGLRDDLPDGMVDRFRRTGTSHVLAISGLHVGVLMAVTLALGRTLLGRRYHLYLLPPLVVVWLYALLSGMSPSVTRAAIMGTVYLAALSLGRPRSVLPALGLAAAVMVALIPNVLTSVSFQLSFAAMAGIALMAEPISRWTQRGLEARLWTGGGLPGPVVAASDITAMTMAATLATLPLVAFYFESVSPAGIPTTLLVLPALPAVLVTQAAAALAGLVSVPAAEPIGWAAWLTSRYVTGVVGLAASVPGASIETGRLSAWLAGAYYGVPALVYVFLRLRRLSRQSDGQSLAMPSFRVMESGVPVWVLAPAVGLTALLWAAVVALPDDRLRVSFVDVGQGDGMFIAMPGGRQVIVDGGPDPVRMVQLVGERMPFQDRTIELVVLTHPHRDHVTGLIEVLRRYDVPVVLERSVELDSASYEVLAQGPFGRGRRGRSGRGRPGDRIRRRVPHRGRESRPAASSRDGLGRRQRLGRGAAGTWGRELPAHGRHVQRGRGKTGPGGSPHRERRSQGGTPRQPHLFVPGLPGAGESLGRRDLGRRGQQVRPSSRRDAGRASPPRKSGPDVRDRRAGHGRARDRRTSPGAHHRTIGLRRARAIPAPRTPRGQGVRFSASRRTRR